jgi:hypothetical protein
MCVRQQQFNGANSNKVDYFCLIIFDLQKKISLTFLLIEKGPWLMTSDVPVLSLLLHCATAAVNRVYVPS